MKKLLTLILLFTITLYSIPTQAFTLDGNNIPLVQTKNLFDKDTATLGIALDGSGNVANSQFRFTHLDFIPIEANQIITLSSDQTTFKRIAFYDSSKNFIIRPTGTTLILTVTAPANTKFFRVTGDISELNTFQLERGNTATSFAPFGFLTLNDIFDDGNLIANPSFETDITGWLTFNSTNTYVGGNLINTSQNFADNARAGTLIVSSGTIGHNYYSIIKARSLNNISIGLFFQVGHLNSNLTGAPFALSAVSNPLQNQYYKISNRGISTLSSQILLRLSHAYVNSATANGKQIEIEYAYSYNLNSLGIDHLSIETLDELYNQYEQNEAFIEGFEAGFAEGFDDGFDDGFGDGLIEGFDNGVASETSFAVGFAQGLLQGGDMETGSSILILIVALIGFGMMIFGFITKRGIFNLLSVAAFIVLGGLLAEFIGFIIITFALVFINVYYAFFGDL